jgi:predicted kinase
VALELVVMVGLQGSGKSTWVREHLPATHVIVSKDQWPHARHREARQRRAVDNALAAGCSVVVDNTNASPHDRAPLIEIARAHCAEVRAVYLDVPLSVCLARNAGRVGRACVPVVGVYATQNRLVPPALDEGFDRIDVVTPGDGS